eukprot:CAMPEP_0171184318 /NCGR_PEP_ID=MMETSP0790-20130122/15728_1 /TAXON_ID=2925 /ORGANISM="Alexandrium catenella, Strain OF101" /LENGTH=464 /DNA_ID=CAMNT_0011649313 /DNA_START=91 /DNA_END=1485 /DNA_ORIENTATION=-
MSSQALLHPDESAYNVLRELERKHILSGPCFPCLRSMCEKEIREMVKTFGEDPEADAEHEHMDYSLFSGAYIAPVSSHTVELEYTQAPANDRSQHYTQETSKVMQADAVARLRKFYCPVLPTGLAIWGLTLGGGYLSGLRCECSEGPSALGFAIPALAILIQALVLNYITILLSQTEVEGRPLLRLLSKLEGCDGYRVMTVMCLVDTFSRFTRAQFVGYIAHCHAAIDGPFTEFFEGYGPWRSFIDWFGISGLAQVSFITGPIIIQFGYMVFLRCKLNKELREASERFPGEDMEVMDSMDDLAALMNWAMLVPAGKVLEMAALPINLDGEEDVERLWDGIKTKVYVYLARDLPDGIMQMNLQAFFFCLVFQGAALPLKLQLLLNIILAGGPVLIDSLDLIFMNRRITTLAGFLLFLLAAVFGGARTIGAFVCESSITGIFEQTFACVPPGIIEVTGWASGTLPG